jgi:Ca2+-binding EF-hand superfamily protein
MRCALLAVSLLALILPAAHALPPAFQLKTAFAALDTSDNKAIGAAEWDAASFALFRVADKNNNNFIDGNELQASAIAQDTFLRADTDRDGRLSVREFMVLRRAIFHIADIDRDDFLAFVEYELLIVMEQVGWVDRNQNGRIELSELTDSLTKAFAQLDTDHDGRLSATEAGHRSAEAFKDFDTDGNGTLTPAEFDAGYRNALTNP